MIGSQELIMILAILLILIGPKRLPEIAKGVGRAMREFNKARASLTNAASSVFKPEEEAEESLLKIARNLEINTEGKAAKQLLEEINRKTVKNKEDADTHENR